jgi:hypothetical protein
MVVTSNGLDRWFLTCRHVIARQNGTIVASDTILQPDAAAGIIGDLSQVVADVTLDCAAFKLTVGASDDVLGVGKLALHAAPIVGMRVLKSGWKTGISEGRIQQVNGNEVVIERLPGYPPDYSLATLGDSGAIWVEAGTLAAVALHCRETAVGPQLAMASDIRSVLRTLTLRQI